MPPRSATRRTTAGSSHAPGQRTTVTSSALPPRRTIASIAPATSGSTISPLNRLATMANRRPAAERVPSMVGMRRRYRSRLGFLVPERAARDRDSLDDLDAEALQRGDLAPALDHQPDLVEAEVREHLRAKAEIAQRLARGGHERVARRRLVLQDHALERRLQPHAAAVHHVQEDARA